MKKIIVFILLVCLISFGACSANKSNNKSSKPSSVADSSSSSESSSDSSVSKDSSTPSDGTFTIEDSMNS